MYVRFESWNCVCYSAEAFCKVSAVCWSGDILPLVPWSLTHYLYLAEDIAMLDEANCHVGLEKEHASCQAHSERCCLNQWSNEAI